MSDMKMNKQLRVSQPFPSYTTNDSFYSLSLIQVLCDLVEIHDYEALEIKNVHREVLMRARHDKTDLNLETRLVSNFFVQEIWAPTMLNPHWRNSALQKFRDRSCKNEKRLEEGR